jgi:hypothetical protein
VASGRVLTEKEDTDKVVKLKEEIDRISDLLIKKVRAIDADIITFREETEKQDNRTRPRF